MIQPDDQGPAETPEPRERLGTRWAVAPALATLSLASLPLASLSLASLSLAEPMSSGWVSAGPALGQNQDAALSQNQDAALRQNQDAALSQGDEFQPAPFHLYDTQRARVRAGEALDHIASKRWSEALAELQALIEEHRGEVLGAERPRADGAIHPSQTDVHAGAGMWAVRQLFGLPDEGKQLYRDRFGPRAEDNLRRAIAASDRGALARVARRWPLTAAAERAWWALGDLEIELGHPADGMRAWARAAAIHIGEPMRTTIDGEDWNQLRADVAEKARAEDKSGALARLDMALQLLETTGEGGDSQKENEASFVTGPARGIAAESLVITAPFAGASVEEAPTGWESAYPLERGPFRETNRLFPKRLNDTIFVNTSRSVHAVDAFDGEERWSLSAYDLGWADVRPREMSDFQQAVDVKERIVSLAASRGVVVAPVQIPWVYQESDQYNELSIIEVIPERRLIALDASTGKPLWNTMPPAGWNGDSGSFAERMTVVGPPTIVGARVLVPMAQLRGRIELQLGCFDLESGDLLWSSPLVTGQRTLNMFGRANIEFSAPPPVVVGDTAIVLTQLGIVAAIDIFTGETRWDTVYEQIPIKPPQYYTAGRLDNRWRNAPPVVTGNTVLAAPYDGKDLFALDLDTGAMLWSRGQRALSDDINVPSQHVKRQVIGGLDILLGADDKHILLGGSRLASIEFMNGVRNGPPYYASWVWPVEGSHQITHGVPVLDRARVYVPGGHRVLAIERDTGLVVEEIPGRLGTGNLLVSDGMLFSSSGRELDARFQWRAMVERARGALAGEDAKAEDAATLVRLLLERAESTLGRGGAVREALVLLDEARDVIKNRAGVTGKSAGDAQAQRRLPGGSGAYQSLRSDLFFTYLLQGHAERARGDASAAREAATEARSLAIDDSQERRALLTLHEIERSRDEDARRRILSELRSPRHRRARVGVSTGAPASRWSGSAALGAVLEALDQGVSGEDAWTDPWTGSIYPTAASAAKKSRPVIAPGAFPRPRTEKQPITDVIESGLFALLSEVEMARLLPAGTAPAVEAELSALHTILRESPNERLFSTSSTSGEWARARIRALRAMYPLSPALSRFEDEATALLERAIETARAPGGSPDLLDAIDSFYPGSGASRLAADVRIEVALESGSAVEIVQIVVDSLGPNWHPGRTTEREAELLAQLAATLGKEGNVELQVGLMGNLARFSPALEIQGPDGERVTLEALHTRWSQQKSERDEGRRAQREAASAASRGFTTSSIKRSEFKGDFTLVDQGWVEGRTKDGKAAPLGEVGFFASSTRLIAFASNDSGKALWQSPESLSITSSNRPPRVTLHDSSWLLVRRNSQVACLDAATGKELWTFQRPGRTIGHIEVKDGMVVVLTMEAASRDLADVHGLDVVNGLELWQLPNVGPSYHPSIKLDGGRFVMLPYNHSRAAVHDLYTGHPLAPIRTGKISDRNARASWVDRDHLVIPYIGGGRDANAVNAIEAYRLDDGGEAWKVDLDRHAGGVKNLLGIIDMPAGLDSEERIRIAMLDSVKQGSSTGGLSLPTIGLHVLNERLGALDQRPLATIETGARLVGVSIRRRQMLHTPLLIALASGDATRRPTVRAIDPRRGRIWEVPAVSNLRVTAARSLPEPVIGDGTLALVASETIGTSGRTRTQSKLMFLDASTGTLLETRTLSSGRDSSNQRGLFAFGSTLVLATKRIMEILE